MDRQGKALTDPIMQFNDYGYTMCSTISGINCSIWDYMGYKVRYYDLALHTVPEVYYDNGWHAYDNSLSAIYTLCDGKTVAGIEDIYREIFVRNTNLERAVQTVEQQFKESPERTLIVEFIRSSPKGIMRGLTE